MLTSRTLFTWKQEAELWERWKNGQSVLAISRGLERRNKTGVQRIVALHGGVAPAPRRRAVAAAPTCRFISVIRAVHGSAAATRTPTACCDSTSREEPISRASPRPTSTQLRCGSINARERPWASKPLPIDCDWCCTDRLNAPPESDPIADMPGGPFGRKRLMRRRKRAKNGRRGTHDTPYSWDTELEMRR